MANLNLIDWKKQISQNSDVIILDVRTPDEYGEGHIEKALNVDFREPQEFLNKIELLDKSKVFYIYCQSGDRGNQACAVLNQMCNVAHVLNLEGGFVAWANYNN